MAYDPVHLVIGATGLCLGAGLAVWRLRRPERPGQLVLPWVLAAVCTAIGVAAMSPLPFGASLALLAVGLAGVAQRLRLSLGETDAVERFRTRDVLDRLRHPRMMAAGDREHRPSR